MQPLVSSTANQSCPPTPSVKMMFVRILFDIEIALLFWQERSFSYTHSAIHTNDCYVTVLYRDPICSMVRCKYGLFLNFVQNVVTSTKKKRDSPAGLSWQWFAQTGQHESVSNTILQEWTISEGKGKIKLSIFHGLKKLSSYIIRTCEDRQLWRIMYVSQDPSHVMVDSMAAKLNR